MKKNSVRFLLVALVVAIAMIMTAIGVSAAPADASAANKNYNAKTLTYTGGDAVAFLVGALNDAEQGEVIVDLQADMTFAAAADYAAVVVKATSEEIPANTITVTSTTGNGIVIGDHYPNVVLYGNFLFKDITYGAAGEKVNGNGLVFPDGCSGTFGYVDGDSWGGITSGAKKANVAGNVTVYNGTYKVIAGNLYKSATTIDSPAVTVRGNARATQGIYGGSYNGSTGKVTGVGTLNVLDEAWATDIGGGGYFGEGASTQGVVATIDTASTEKITRIVAGMTGTYTNEATFTMTIKNAVVDYVAGSRATTGKYESSDKMTVNLIIEGGTVNNNVYGCLYPTAAGKDKDVNGNYNVTIKNGTFEGAVYGGSYVNNTETKPMTIGTVSTLTIENGDFNAGIYGADAVISSAVANGEDSSAVMKSTGSYSLVIKNGDFASTIYGGAYMVRNANYDAATTNLTIENGVFASNVFGGSNIHADATECIDFGADLTALIEGGTFKDRVYFGSNMYQVGTVDAHSVHSGNTTAVVKGGEFRVDVYGGSLIPANKYGEHSGDSVLTLQGTEGKVIKVKTYVAAGSNASYYASHSGKSTLNLNNIVTSNAVDGKTVTFAKYSTSDTLYFFGGSLLNSGVSPGTAYHTDDSAINIKNSVLQCADTKGIWVVAGSRMDGHKNIQMTGDSVLTVDASEENGFAYIDVELFGGSWLNGYYTSTNYSQAMQTGNSKVVLKAPADRVADNLAHQLTIAANVFGGTEFKNNDRHWAYGDAAVYVNGYVDVADNAIIFGGHEYPNGRSLLDGPDTSYYGDARVSSTKVVIDGTYEGDVYGGCRNSRNTSVTYELNTGIVLKSGSVLGDMYLGSMNASNAANYPDVVHTYTGVVLFELWDAPSNSDGMKVIFAQDARTAWDSTVKKGFKIVGNFSDRDTTTGSNSAYDIYTNLTFNTLDYIQESGGLVLGKCTDEGEKIYKEGSTTSVQSAYGTGIERIEYRKLIKICTSASTASNAIQIPFVAGMTFEEFLNQDGVKIHNSYDPSKTSTKSNNIASYADIVRYNALSESPNVYRFFAVNADGTKGEEITVIGAGTTKYYVQVGNYTSSMTTVENSSIEETANIIKADNKYIGTGFSIRTGSILGFRYRAKIDKAFFETYTAEISGEATFKLAELGIKASATINGNPWSANAVAWKDGALVSTIGGGAWHEDESDPDSYYFGAVITGFGTAADRYVHEFEFSVYAVYEDINGEKVEVVIGEAATSSLYETAQKLATEPEYVEWYTENKEDVDAILAVVENA